MTDRCGLLALDDDGRPVTRGPRLFRFRECTYRAHRTVPRRTVERARELAGRPAPRGRLGRRRYERQVNDVCWELLRLAVLPSDIKRLVAVCGDDDAAWREVVTAVAGLYNECDLTAGGRYG